MLQARSSQLPDPLTLFHIEGGWIPPAEFLGFQNICSQTGSSTKSGKFFSNLMENLVMISTFQNKLLRSRDMTIFGKR